MTRLKSKLLSTNQGYTPLAGLGSRRVRHGQRHLEGPYGANLRAPPEGPIYLYLTQPEWAKSWINGGKIPLSPASRYLGERQGTSTPDEVRQLRWDGAREEDVGYLFRGPFGTILMNDCQVNGKQFESVRLDRFNEDALVLCFSTELSSSLMRRLGKNCCIEIMDFDALLQAVSNALGQVRYGQIRYTTENERSHFMKGQEDEWQHEYRIIVPRVSAEAWIDIPSGLGRAIEIAELPV